MVTLLRSGDHTVLELENDDWLRTITWDLWVDGELVETAPQLLSALNVLTMSKAIQREAVGEFLKLPAAEAMPKELRRDLRKRGLIGSAS